MISIKALQFENPWSFDETLLLIRSDCFCCHLMQSSSCNSESIKLVWDGNNMHGTTSYFIIFTNLSINSIHECSCMTHTLRIIGHNVCRYLKIHTLCSIGYNVCCYLKKYCYLKIHALFYFVATLRYILYLLFAMMFVPAFR